MYKESEQNGTNIVINLEQSRFCMRLHHYKKSFYEILHASYCKDP